MSNLIQQLKDNEKPFGLMGENDTEHNLMRDKLMEIGYRNCQVFRGNWGDFDQPFDRMSNRDELTFRLRDTYEDEPEIVECEIQEDGLGKFYYNRPDGITNCSLSTAVNYSDFIGFKFKDGTVMGSPVKYSVPGITSHGYYTTYEDLKTKQALEHHACTVLFKRKKEE